jgi:hypothetical protein
MLSDEHYQKKSLLSVTEKMALMPEKVLKSKTML